MNATVINEEFREKHQLSYIDYLILDGIRTNQLRRNLDIQIISYSDMASQIGIHDRFVHVIVDSLIDLGLVEREDENEILTNQAQIFILTE